MFFWPPVASAAGGARGYDCGPEPSLRTSPLSTSYAFGSLRFPSGASTRPAIPHRPRHALAMRRNDGLWGELCAWRFGAHRSWREGLAGPAASRPRGRPFAAYVVSCVGMMTLSRVERPPIRCYCTAIGTTKRALSGAIARLPAPRLLSAAHALVTRKPALNAPPLPPPPSERNHQKTARHPRAAHPLHFQMHRRLSWPPARPRWAAPQIPFPAPGSSSATSPDARGATYEDRLIIANST